MLGGFLSSLGGGIGRFSSDSDDIIVGDSDTAFHASADLNIAIGSGALDSTSGDADGNIAIGINSLTSLTTADYLTAIGYNAGYGATTGGGNVAIGSSSAMWVGTGNNNTAVGASSMSQTGAGTNSKDSDENTFIGASSGGGSWEDAKSEENTAVGYLSMYGLMDGALGNVAVGHESLKAVTTGDYNVAIGSGAGDAITAAIGVVAIGASALSAAHTRNGTVMIGQKAGELLTTGDHCIGIGYGALGVHVDGDRNIAMGYGAMGDTNAGGTSDGSTDNLFIGQLSGGGEWANALSIQNVGIGNYTLNGLMNASSYNTAVGFQAGKAIVQGDYNVFIGKDAGLLCEDGSYNTFVGGWCGDATTQGYNTAVGFQSLSAAAGTYNTCLGQYAGKDTTGTGNTLIGYHADTDNASDDFQTRIGYGGILKYITIRESLGYGGTDENDPAHGTASLGKIPQYSVITRATVLVTTLSSDADHSLKLILSTDSSSTDNTALNGVQEVIGAGNALSWSGGASDGAASDINVASGATIKTAYAAIAPGNDGGLSTLDTTAADLYLYMAFANGSHTNGDTNPSTAPVVDVMVEYVGID